MRVRALNMLVAVVALALTHCVGSAQSREPSPQVQGDLKALARQSLAKIDGEVPSPELHDAVEVIRHKWGVPHTYAKNMDDLFFAQDYVMGQDRLWQLEIWRRQR